MNKSFSKPAYRFLAVLNILAFLVMILFNALAALLPLNGKTTGQLSDQYPNLFTPAGVTFSIWSVIYLFLLGFIIYQAWVLFSSNHPSKDKIRIISPWFMLNGLANAGWIVAWHYEQVLLSVFIMLLLLISLVIIYQKLQLALPWQPLTEKCWLDIPFSLYLGWIVIATIANITALLVSRSWNGGGLSEEIWTIIMVMAGMLIALIMIFFRDNIIFGLVYIWTFYGIILKRQDAGEPAGAPIILWAGIGIGILASGILIQLARQKKTAFTPPQRLNRTG